MTILTSFDPFGGSEKNYSNLSSDLIESDGNLDKIQLPVCYRECYEKLRKKLDEKEYDNVILLGQAGARTKVTIEKIAINWMSATIPDNSGALVHGEKLLEDGPDGIFSKVDVTKLVDTLKSEGFDCDVSYSAGTYVCNALYYQTLIENPDKNVIFIHVPAKDEENSAKIIRRVIDQLS